MLALVALLCKPQGKGTLKGDVCPPCPVTRCCRHLVIRFSPFFATGPDGSSRRTPNRIAACGAYTYNYDFSARLITVSLFESILNAVSHKFFFRIYCSLVQNTSSVSSLKKRQGKHDRTFARNEKSLAEFLPFSPAFAGELISNAL